MSLSLKNLASIQKAGETLHTVSGAVAASVHSHAASMVASVASQPFGVDSEQAFSRFKTLAGLSQGLIAVEAKLRELYAVATALANPASDVVITLPLVSVRKASNKAAIDVVAKPAKAVKTAKVKVKKPRKKNATSGGLTANDSKLLHYLQGALNADGWTAQTGAIMATGSGLPLGSVGVSLKKILAIGAVKTGDRGMYQLGAAAKAPAQNSALNTTSSKKIKAASKKKVKARVSKKTKPVDAPSDAEVALV